MTEAELITHLLDWHPYRLGPTTLIEARDLPGIPPGTLGRVEGNYERIGISVMIVRWNDLIITSHSIRPATRWMGYEIVDSRILYAGDLDHEGPRKRIERAQRNGTSSLSYSGEIGQTFVFDLAGPWETERCPTCYLYHHEWRVGPSTEEIPEGGGLSCGECGSGKDEPLHHGLRCAKG